MTEPLKPGDFVRWNAGSTWQRYEEWGQVTRVTPKGTVFAKYLDREHHDEREFRGGRGVWRATAHEVAKRIWYRSRPQFRFVCPATSFARPHEEDVYGVHVEVDSIKTPENAYLAGEELKAFAAWWEREPKK